MLRAAADEWRSPCALQNTGTMVMGQRAIEYNGYERGFRVGLMEVLGLVAHLNISGDLGRRDGWSRGSKGEEGGNLGLIESGECRRLVRLSSVVVSFAWADVWTAGRRRHAVWQFTRLDVDVREC
jgi:hypothetical protein